MAVDLFFALSGFVFFWLYSEKINSKAIGAYKFFVMRFTRLYPLHLLTLIAVILLQIRMRQLTGSYFVYHNFDLKHLLLNITLTANWFNQGFSFNGPTWSISIELLLYIVFFCLCRVVKPKLATLLIMIAIGIAVLRFDELIGRGIISFFVGGVIRHFYVRREAQDVNSDAGRGNKETGIRPGWFNEKASFTLVCLLTLASWGIVLLDTKYDLYAKLAPELSRSHLNGLSHHLLEKITRNSYNFFASFVLYPMTIVTFLALERRYSKFFEKIAWIGNASFSAYLIHFPLQITFLIVTGRYGADRSLFLSPVMLIAFFALLIALSLLSYHYIEMPAQKTLRKWLTKEKGREVVSPS